MALDGLSGHSTAPPGAAAWCWGTNRRLGSERKQTLGVAPRSGRARPTTDMTASRADRWASANKSRWRGGLREITKSVPVKCRPR
jgi:hypothetical protein